MRASIETTRAFAQPTSTITPPSERRGVGVCTGPVSGKQKKNRLQFLCGALQAWLGHKNIQHTVRYAELAPDRFKDFWQ